jgi:hypothetical protein
MLHKSRVLITTLLLSILFVAPIGWVHGQECGDVDNSGSVAATDALLVLKFAVGQGVSLVCAAGAPTPEYITFQDRISIPDPIQFVSQSIFVVPTGKRFLVDYISLDLDAVISVVTSNPVDVEGLPVKASINNYVLGLMEVLDRTTRGAPQRFIGRSVNFSFPAGSDVRIRVSPEFSGVNLDFGFLDYVVTGRLIDEP